MASSDQHLIVIALKQESQGLFEKGGFQPLYTGIGKLNAAFTLERALQKQKKPQFVINLGTAGCHKIKSGRFQLHQLVECTSFIQRDLQQIHKKAEILETARQTDLISVRCGTADFIEFSEPKIECDIMDMEAYALAAVCKRFEVPFMSVKYITDSSDEKTVSDWNNHISLASRTLCEFYQVFSQKKS